MINLEKVTDQAIELAMNYGPKLVLAILTLIIGLWIIKRVIRVLDKTLQKGKVEVTLQRFLINVASVLLKAVLLISVASMVGIETTSLIAMLGAAGLAVGLALQGSLANFAGGVLILFFKPFKVGDLIEAEGHLGIVKEIQIFNTILRTLDNRRVIIPNGTLSNGCLTNLNAEGTRRVDMTFGISYSDDVLKAKDVLRKLMTSDERVLQNPAPEVYVSAHADSSINMLVRGWVKPENYWGVFFGMHEQVKLTFDREGISIPFPQRDVHLFNASSNA